MEDNKVNEVAEYMQSELKKNFIKNIMVGFETANQMIIDKIDAGCDIYEIRDFCKLNIKNKNKITNIIIK